MVEGADGQLHQPLKEAAGKPVAMIFFSHDCPVCNIYAPEISRIEAKYGKKINVDIVYTDARITRAEAIAHAKAFGLNQATLLFDKSGSFAAFCNAHVTPQAAVFDSRGRRVYCGRIDDRFLSLGQQRPAPTTHDLASALDATLANKPAKPATGAPVGCIISWPKNS